MRARIHATLPFVLAIIGLACSNGNSGKLVQDTGPDTSRVEDVQGRGEVCVPQCDERVCGANGCGGSCGQCEMIKEVCSDEGKCVPAPCTSTLDCPSNLVCHKGSGECVVCVGDEDCPEDTTCGANHECNQAYPCDSDKDCKDLGMVCDKEAGLCVECLGPEECPADKYCLGGYCVADECVGGEAKCIDGSVEACAGDGSAWQVDAVCGANQHCLEAACHDNVCPPGETYCDDGTATTCDTLGSAVAAEEDCKAQGLNCYNGTCTESVCPPNETFCVDNATAAACAADGMSFTTAACKANQYCDGGTCHAQVCEPSSTYCEENKVTVCNSKGSAIQSTTDCGNLVCVAGGCHELICSPGALYCDGKALMECDTSGTATNLLETCGDGQYCGEDGNAAACQDQVCVPDSLSCDGTTIVQCDDLGASWIPGDDCAEDNKGCLDGECVEQYCGDGIKQDGEECDDGNEQACDGCEGCENRRFLSFDGTSGSYGEVIDSEGMPLSLVGHPFTVEGWMRVQEFNGWVKVFRRGSGNSGWAFGIEDGLVGVGVFGGFNHWPEVELLGTGWHHVAWTFGLGYSRIWLDGLLLSELETSKVVKPTASPLRFGVTEYDNGSITGWARGDIDEFRVSNTIRYESPFLPQKRLEPDTDTLGLWHFDESEGNSLIDSSPLGHNGEAKNITWKPNACED